MADGLKLEQRHGKSRVRVARVWRNSVTGKDLIVEWRVAVSLVTDCLPAFTSGENSSIVATDSMKNTVYVKAKECTEVVSVEEFAIILAKHFTSLYPQVESATISIVEKPWERLVLGRQPHSHGFKAGSEKHTAEVTLKKNGTMTLTSGIEGLAVLKTTKVLKDSYGINTQFFLIQLRGYWLLKSQLSGAFLEDDNDQVSCARFVWYRYAFEWLSDIPPKPFCFTQRYQEVKEVLLETFFGPPQVGVYSPSVQNTLYLMAKAVLNKFLDVTSLHLRMPNLHFLPVNLTAKTNPNMVKFADDVYMPTNEPHGTIEATVTRCMSKM
ncbi:uricase isoform X1 [Dioscorea cayenensis subsp. rotundata]|uniref:Uricase n=1 Tax=Dioscorea cayennensis subsp. rotundata TaxID=55577 RepID=A0AB40CEN1_DIOCR|nr:uricase isoform X1 [Dioscorea cayenensis subsp. rotundata]